VVAGAGVTPLRMRPTAEVRLRSQQEKENNFEFKMSSETRGRGHGHDRAPKRSEYYDRNPAPPPSSRKLNVIIVCDISKNTIGETHTLIAAALKDFFEHLKQ
jgi:hypothetical protein